MEQVLEQEKYENEQRRIERELIEKETKKKKLQDKEALIDELMSSYDNASKILDNYAKNAEKVRVEAKVIPVIKQQAEFSTGVKFGQQGLFFSVPKIEEGPLYAYEAPIVITDGPYVPPLNAIENNGYTRHIRGEMAIERAGGFKSGIACQRAIQEALQGLFHGS